MPGRSRKGSLQKGQEGANLFTNIRGRTPKSKIYLARLSGRAVTDVGANSKIQQAACDGFADCTKCPGGAVEDCMKDKKEPIFSNTQACKEHVFISLSSPRWGGD